MQIEEITTSIGQILDDQTGLSLSEQKTLRKLELHADRLEVCLEFPYPINGLQDMWHERIQKLLPLYKLDLTCGTKIARHQALKSIASNRKIRNIIAISSSKGGVGKSTTSLAMARALQSLGARVALLDADIHGPNLPDLLKVSGQAAIKDKRFQPVIIDGLPTMSIAYLVDPEKPTIWRGPMVSGALEQLYKQTDWPELDYLLIDLPPGTGDVQLTLSKKIPLAGIVLVTTPEILALVDLVKGIEMFKKVKIPVLGLIENMAQHVCTNCGHESDLFGHNKDVAAIAARYKITQFASIPFSRALQGGTIDADLQAQYQLAARKMAAELSLQAKHYGVHFAEVVQKKGDKDGDQV